MQSNASVAVTCTNAELIVQASNSVIAVDGVCDGTIIIGNQNRITVKRAIGDIEIYGNDNRLVYSGTATVIDRGSGNAVSRR